MKTSADIKTPTKDEPSPHDPNDVLRRMLNTPPKPHEGKPAQKVAAKKRAKKTT